MQLIGRIFVDNIGNRRAASTIFGIVGVPKYVHFLDRFDILRLQRLSSDVGIVVVESIDEEIIGARSQTIGSEARPVREIIPARDCRYPWLSGDQFDWVEAGNRQLFNFGSGNGLAQFTVVGLNESGPGGDGCLLASGL